MKSEKSLDSGNKRDSRCKCDACGGWMRHTPTLKTPNERQTSPYANYCTGCCKLENGLVSLFG